MAVLFEVRVVHMFPPINFNLFFLSNFDFLWKRKLKFDDLISDESITLTPAPLFPASGTCSRHQSSPEMGLKLSSRVETNVSLPLVFSWIPYSLLRSGC